MFMLFREDVQKSFFKCAVLVFDLIHNCGNCGQFPKNFRALFEMCPKVFNANQHIRTLLNIVGGGGGGRRP